MPHPRPLSPHLQVYRPQISSVLSILHRITGVALAFGSGLLAFWLWAAAYNAEWYDILTGWFATTFGMVMLAGWSAAFYYHLGNGIRHLFWDAGYGYSLPVFTRSGYAVLAFTALMTGLTWWCVTAPQGGTITGGML